MLATSQIKKYYYPRLHLIDLSLFTSTCFSPLSFAISSHQYEEDFSSRMMRRLPTLFAIIYIPSQWQWLIKVNPFTNVPNILHTYYTVLFEHQIIGIPVRKMQSHIRPSSGITYTTSRTPQLKASNGWFGRVRGLAKR